MDFSKKTSIRYETELAIEFGRFVVHDNRLKGFKLIPTDRPEKATFQLDRRIHHFTLKFLLNPTVADIPSPTAKSQPLLVVPKLSDHFLDACRQKGVSAADLNGQLFLRGPELLVSLPRLPNRDYRFELEPRNVFVGKSVRIVRSLLSDPEHLWRQSELIEQTGATSGLVSRIVTYLTHKAFLEKVDARRFRLVSNETLLDAWAKADDFGRRTITHRYAAFDGEPLKLARAIRNILTHGGPHFAFTQWIAAWLRHPYTEPPVVSLYVPQLPSQEVFQQLGLRSVEDAGRVWFHIPNDEGVFRGTRVVDTLPLVADAQIYIDLLQTGLRGPEQAQALREWSGFCRP